VRRTRELAEQLKGDVDLQSWALSAGFGSAERLKRACLNVLGLSLRELERRLAGEVLQFYFCAEDLALRTLACRAENSADVFRAREIYHGSEDMPEAPFTDEWAKHEELKAEWLSRIREVLDCRF
jgi:hypothetical protein